MNGHNSSAWLMLGAAAIAAAGLLLSGCSDVVFPAVHDMPVPRADATLTPDQVKEATDNLISQRDHLTAEAQGNGQPNAAANVPAANATAAGATANAVSKSKKKPPPSAPSAAQPAVTGSTQTSSAYAKP